MAAIDRVRAIVANRQYADIDGFRVDLFTASAIIAVYDKLSTANQSKMATMPIQRMAEIALKLTR